MENSYFLPAEWHPHESTWLSWPINEETWAYQLNKVQNAYADFITAIALDEKVNLIVEKAHQEKVAELLSKKNALLSNIQFHDWKTNDAWIRDYGPDFLLSTDHSSKQILDWQYNAWGGKYPPFLDDNRIPEKVSNLLNIPSRSLDFILEGGSIEVNGKGTLLTTASCLLNKNRNPSYSKQSIETLLCTSFGVKNVIWLGDGIVGDDTDGHVDDMTRFVNETTILTAVETNKSDANYLPLKENLEVLKKIRLENDKQPTIVELPIPAPFYYENERLPASYANFYICNEKVIVPVFNDSTDDKAVQIIQSCFPDREIVPIYSGDIIYGLGSFHCLSKQEPALQ